MGKIYLKGTDYKSFIPDRKLDRELSLDAL
jgi:hypothetical protein